MTDDTAARLSAAAAAGPGPPGQAGSAPVLKLGLALGLVVAAQFVLQLDFSIVNVALPTIKRELHFAPADLQWIVTGYALTFGSLLLFGGGSGTGRATAGSCSSASAPSASPRSRPGWRRPRWP